MQNAVNNNIKNTMMHFSQQTNDVSHSVPNHSIRFAFPERPSPPQHEHTHIRPYRSATLNSLQTNSSHYYTSTKHCYNDSFWSNFPFCTASFLSVIGTFLCVRAIAVRGYLVDHSVWDGRGNTYDQNPLIFLNTIEVLLIMISLLSGLFVCALVILKTRIYQNSVSSYCLIGALMQASCAFGTTILFYGRTLDLVQTLESSVYSRGFYSCMISGCVMLLAMFGFLLDWLLDSPTHDSLSVILNAMLLPSVMYCSILSIGAITFMWIERWEYSQAMMFCATALTTIGYGDVAPVTPLGRLVFLVYAAFGICVVGYFLLSLRAVMINGSSFNLMMKVNLMRVESLHNYARQQRQRDRQRNRFEQQHWQQQQYAEGVFTKNQPPLPTSSTANDYENDADDNDNETHIAATTTVYGSPKPYHQLARHRSTDVISTFSNYTLANILNEEKRQMWVHVITHPCVFRMSVIFTLSWFGGAAVFCLLEENWSYLDALYFAFATQLTIGFGDLVPQTMIAQEFWFVYIIISIAVAAYFICLFGDVLAEKLLIDGDGYSDSGTDDNDGGGDCGGYEPNRYNGTGEMVKDNDMLRYDRISRVFTNHNNTNADMINTTSIYEPYHYPHQQSATTSTWTTSNLRQHDNSGHQPSFLSRRLHSPSPQQDQQPVYHQPLQRRINSLPIISINQYQKRHTYGTLDQGTLSHNKKNKHKFKSSKYLPVAITDNTQRLL